MKLIIPFLALGVEANFGTFNFQLKRSSQQPLIDRTKGKPGVFKSLGLSLDYSSIPNLDIRGFSGLVERQSCDPGWHLCNSGGCCPDTSTCVSGGCCRGTTSALCGADNCYDTSEAKCCGSSGLVCYQEDSCQDGGCCDANEDACGTGGCYDPDEYVCCSSTSTHCPKGYDCIEGGDCCPSGMKPCGSSKCYDPDTQVCCDGDTSVWACPKSDKCCSTGYCYDADTEICCDNGSCDDDTTCCDNECCTDVAFCGSDGYCSLCPDETRTVTSTLSSTSVVVSTDTVTEVVDNEPTGFSCAPMTVTNDDAETLILGEDCGLTYEPASTPTSSSDGSQRLQVRQASCRAAPATRTTTKYVTKGFTESSTTTLTITEVPTELGFSCPPMEATNDVGDVLALDEDCSLSLSLAEPTTTSQEQVTVTVQGGGDSSSSSDGDSAANLVGTPFVSGWALLVVWIAGFLALGLFA